jgi:hypothetical protein
MSTPPPCCPTYSRNADGTHEVVSKPPHRVREIELRFVPTAEVIPFQQDEEPIKVAEAVKRAAHKKRVTPKNNNPKHLPSKVS